MSAPRGESVMRSAVVLWGVLGVVVMLVEAIYRLALTAVRHIRTEGLSPQELVSLVVWTAAICYVEGYRGFQQRFSPRVVVRALHLAAHPRPLHVALAPIYCMALFHATRRRLIAMWGLTLGIVGLIVIVRHLPPASRAIVDAGVALALAWGTLSILVFLARALLGKPPRVPAEVPGEPPLAAERADAAAPAPPALAQGSMPASRR